MGWAGAGVIVYGRRQREVREVISATCDECGCELAPAFPDFGFGQSPQADDALVVELHGGYGMYFDNIDGTPILAWCKECADRIRTLVPSLDKALTPPEYEPDDD